jgi:hypothetical protein
MAKINFIHDKPLIEDVFQYDIILFGTGIHNALGNGFQYDVKINFPFVEEAIKKTPYADTRKLGTVEVINGSPIYCVGYIHRGGYRKDITPDYLNYDALKDVLFLVNHNFICKRIGLPLIGCSKFDGNGDKEKVIEMLNELSDENNNEYFIYDYEQRDYREVNNEKWANIINQVGKIPYDELRKMKDEFIKVRKFGIHGINKSTH